MSVTANGDENVNRLLEETKQIKKPIMEKEKEKEVTDQDTNKEAKSTEEPQVEETPADEETPAAEATPGVENGETGEPEQNATETANNPRAEPQTATTEERGTESNNLGVPEGNATRENSANTPVTVEHVIVEEHHHHHTTLQFCILIILVVISVLIITVLAVASYNTHKLKKIQEESQSHYDYISSALDRVAAKTNISTMQAGLDWMKQQTVGGWKCTPNMVYGSYQFYNKLIQKGTKTAAIDLCRKQCNASLSEPRTQEDLEFISSLAGGNYVWSPFEFTPQDDTWRLPNGIKAFGIEQLWAAGEPRTGNSCAYIASNGSHVGLKSGTCDLNINSICARQV